MPVFIGLNSVLRYHIHPTAIKAFLFINDIFEKLCRSAASRST